MEMGGGEMIPVDGNCGIRCFDISLICGWKVLITSIEFA